MEKNHKIIVGLLIVCAVLALILAVSSRSKPAENTGEGASNGPSEETTEIEAEPVYTIETDYCDLKFPEKWQAFVTATPTEGVPYTVKFSHIDGTPLFDIAFGGASGTYLGTAESKKGDVAVYYVRYELDENNVNYYDQIGMQEAANVIVENLKKDYVLSDEAPAASGEGSEVFAVETPFATLYYPKTWEDRLTVNTEGNCVSFSCGDTRLFDIRFEQCDGAYLGTYDKTPVYVVSYEITQDGFTAEQYRDLCAMQDDVNVILEYLKKDAKFE